MRHPYQRRGRPADAPSVESATSPTGEGDATLAALVQELRETKALDLSSKRAGLLEDRAALAEMIYDLVRHIAAMRGADRG
jgi:hypothetical protein